MIFRYFINFIITIHFLFLNFNLFISHLFAMMIILYFPIVIIAQYYWNFTLITHYFYLIH